MPAKWSHGRSFRLWPGDVFVDFELNLNTLVARLREALGDSAENPRYIETLPKRGYRFLAAVSESAASEPAPKPRARLVVLPFKNVGGDPAEEYFSDAMTDELITDLCQVAPGTWLDRPTTATLRTADGPHGCEPGIIVEGTPQRDQVAMNVQLIRASDQTHVFARKYDARCAICSTSRPASPKTSRRMSFVSGLHVGGRMIKRPTEDLQAHELCFGRHYMYKRDPQSRPKHECLKVSRDPRSPSLMSLSANIIGGWVFGATSPRGKPPSWGSASCSERLRSILRWPRPMPCSDDFVRRSITIGRKSGAR
jgi:TolB-like protein